MVKVCGGSANPVGVEYCRTQERLKQPLREDVMSSFPSRYCLPFLTVQSTRDPLCFPYTKLFSLKAQTKTKKPQKKRIRIGTRFS